MYLAQLPGADTVITQAAAHGWEAAVLVVIVLSILTFTVWFLKQHMAESTKREERLADRVSNLEDFIRTQLISELQRNSEIMSQVIDAAKDITKTAESVTTALANFTAVLSVRPCMLSPEDQAEAMEKLTKRQPRDTGPSHG